MGAAEPTAADWVAIYADRARWALLARDVAIRQMRAEGASFRTIAEAAGLTAGGVKKIVDRQAPTAGGGAVASRATGDRRRRSLGGPR